MSADKRIAVAGIGALVFHAALAAIILAIPSDWIRPLPKRPDYLLITLQPSAGRAAAPISQAPKTVMKSSPMIAPSLRNARVRPRHKRSATAPRARAPAARETPEAEVSPAAASVARGAAERFAALAGTATMNGPESSLGSGFRSGPIPGDQVDQPPVVISMITPNYPAVARLHEIQGVVLLQIVVDESGRVEHDIKVLESIPLLDQAAIDAVRTWRFAPGRDRNGVPVRVLLEVPLRFTLRISE